MGTGRTRESDGAHLDAGGVEGELEGVAPRGELAAARGWPGCLRRAGHVPAGEVPVLAVHHDVLAQNAPGARLLKSRRARELAEEDNLGGVDGRIRGGARGGTSRGGASHHRDARVLSRGTGAPDVCPDRRRVLNGPFSHRGAASATRLASNDEFD